MKETVTMQEKLKILKMLYEMGCNTEKDLQTLDMKLMLDIPNIKIHDIKIIVEIQEQVKANKLFSYLGGEANDN